MSGLEHVHHFFFGAAVEVVHNDSKGKALLGLHVPIVVVDNAEECLCDSKSHKGCRKHSGDFLLVSLQILTSVLVEPPELVEI